MRYTLCNPTYYRGVLYPIGSQEIPDELAALISQNCWIRHPSRTSDRIATGENAGASDGAPDSGDTGSGGDGETETPVIPEAETPEVTEPPALALVNDAVAASELTVLPGIGNAGSTILFDNRPVGGYLTFVALTVINVALTVTPFSVDWDAVEAWTP